jgi:ferredoxin
MRVVVHEARCQGHTLCHMVAGEIFKLRDEDGHAYVDDEHVSDTLGELALKAEAGCPEQAIAVYPDR